MNASGQTDKRKMLQTMIFGAVLIFFTGFVHIWSVFVPHVMALTGWTEGQTTMAFYLSNGFFVAGSNYGFVMIGLIISTLCAPVLRSVLGGFGLPEQGMYYVGLLFAAAAFLLLSGIRQIRS